MSKKKVKSLVTQGNDTAARRVENPEQYRKNYDAIFKKKPKLNKALEPYEL